MQCSNLQAGNQGFPPQKSMRERVAIAIRDADGCGMTIRGQGITIFCDNPGLGEDCQPRCGCREYADAAIDACLAALLEIELPEEVFTEACHNFWFGVGTEDAQKHDMRRAFRTIIMALADLAKLDCIVVRDVEVAQGERSTSALSEDETGHSEAAQ
jgi:hypothetical protein